MNNPVIVPKVITNERVFLLEIEKADTKHVITSFELKTGYLAINFAEDATLLDKQDMISFIQSFDNDTEYIPQLTYVNQIFPQVTVSSQLYSYLFLWRFNGLNVDQGFWGIGILSYVTKPSTHYYVRVYDKTNTKTLVSKIYQNEKPEMNCIEISKSLLPMFTFADLEIHAKLDSQDATVIIQGLSILYEKE